MLKKYERLKLLLIGIPVILAIIGLFFFGRKNEEVKPDVKTYYVSPSGDDANSGLERGEPFQTIQVAIDQVQPGEVVYLLDGEYRQDFISRNNGRSNAPIIIKGGEKAVVKGGGAARIIEINHDHIWLEGFTVDGFFGEEQTAESYRDKLIYVQGKDIKEGVTGLKISGMEIKNGGGECVRLRYFATKNEIFDNRILNCGIHDFRFDGGGKNGEGIYIGTAPEQLGDGKNPTTDPDESNMNWIHDNMIDTQGNECVDIKEASSGNIVESNDCTGQKDTESGGLDSRGNGNIFRENVIYKNMGAGIRLGGDETDDGQGNSVYSNVIRDNRSGGIKFQAYPQELVCGNEFRGNGKGDYVGSFSSEAEDNYKRKCPLSKRLESVRSKGWGE